MLNKLVQIRSLINNKSAEVVNIAQGFSGRVNDLRKTIIEPQTIFNSFLEAQKAQLREAVKKIDEEEKGSSEK